MSLPYSLMLKVTAAVALLSPLARAGEPDFISPPITTGPAPAAGDPWEVTVSPYVWIAGADGQVGSGDAVVELPFELDKVFDDLSLIGAMLAVDVRKGRWGVQLDGLWVHLELDGSTPGPLFGDANAEVDFYRLAPMLSYSVLKNEDTTVDLLAGGQYMYADVELDLNAGILAATERSFSKGFWDPDAVGFRLRHQLSEKWSLLARAEIGGFGVSSDFVWQAFGAIGYQCCPNGTILLGWRHLDVKYESGPVLLDLYTSGPLLGFSWTF